MTDSRLSGPWNGTVRFDSEERMNEMGLEKGEVVCDVRERGFETPTREEEKGGILVESRVEVENRREASIV